MTMIDWIERKPVIGKPVSVFVRAIGEMSGKDGFEISGYIAYSAMFALFPFLIFLTALGGLLGNEESTRTLINYIIIYLPKDVADTLVPVVYQVTQSTHGGLLTVGVIGTLWSASSGVDALRLAMNRAYELKETRSWFWRKAQSIIFVVTGVVIVLSLSVLIILGPYLWKLVTFFMPEATSDGPIFHLGRYMIGLAILTMALVFMHRWLPNRRIAWRDIVPGAIFTTLFWTMCATAFSYYLGKFAHYGATYGSLGGVIATLLFFYLTAAVFILGGEVNATVYRRKHPDQPAAVKGLATGATDAQGPQTGNPPAASR